MTYFHGQMAEKLPEQIIKLDVKDRKILFELSKNARYSNTRIGKMVGLSREVVKYRIKNMMQRNILTGFITLIDLNKLGFAAYILYIKTDKKEKEIIDFLVKHQSVFWVATCGGGYNIVFSVLSKRKNILGKIITQLNKLCKLNQHIVLKALDESYLPQYYLIQGMDYQGKKYKKSDGSFDKQFHQRKSNSQIKIDKKDHDLLKLLSINSRMPVLEISKSLDLATTAVTRRIEKLIQSGIIRGFMPLISLHLLGLEWYMTLLNLRNAVDKQKRELINYLYHHSHILWYVEFIGRYNLELSIFAKDSAHYNNIINDLKEKFNDVILSYDFVVIFRQHKFIYSI